MTTEWKQERPTWCCHGDCGFLRRAMDDICGGELPAPVPHGGGENTHRFCLHFADDMPEVFDLQVNPTDLDFFRWIFDALDGKQTSWLSQLSHHQAALGSPCVRCGAGAAWAPGKTPELDRALCPRCYGDWERSDLLEKYMPGRISQKQWQTAWEAFLATPPSELPGNVATGRRAESDGV